jgi:hypothetical protein
MSLPGYDAWKLASPPEGFELADETETQCLGSYPETDRTDAYVCEARTTCYLCEGVVCSDHDDTAKCDGYTVHEKCHSAGCPSTSCEQDRRDDFLQEQADSLRDERDE